MQTLTALKAEKYVVSIQTPEGHYKVAQIICANDGSLFVTLPYYKKTNGTATHAKLHRNLPYPQSLDLGIGGNVTSHLVKYSHHADGRAHFSQDGKVLTRIKTQSIELNKANGHIFTIQLQGLKDFTNVASKDQKPDKKKFLLRYCFEKREPEAIKILGFWHSFSTLQKMLQESENSPIHEFNLPNGRQRFGYTLSVGGNNFQECQYLLLQCEEVPKLTEETNSFLLFLGGFDPPEIAHDHTKDTSFLILAYPLIGNIDEIAKRIGSIDLITMRGIIDPILQGKILPPGELSERFPYNVLNQKEEDQGIKSIIKDWWQNGMDFRETINRKTGKKTRICIDSGDIHKKIEEKIGRKFEIGEDGKIILKGNPPPIFYKKIAKNFVVLTGPIFEPTSGIHGRRINIEGDGEKEWIREIEALLNKTSYTDNQNRYIEAALIELKQEVECKKPRGKSQQVLRDNPSASEIKKDAPILYYWLRSQIVDQRKRYQHIDSELERMKLITGQWRNPVTAKKLTFELIKRKYRKSNWDISFQSFFDTYIKQAMSEKEAERILQDEECALWAMLANKFLHMDSILWILQFQKCKILVVKNPEIVQKNPLICKFEVCNEKLTNFQEKKLTYKDKDLSWFDT